MVALKTKGAAEIAFNKTVLVFGIDAVTASTTYFVDRMVLHPLPSCPLLARRFTVSRYGHGKFAMTTQACSRLGVDAGNDLKGTLV